MIAFLRTIPAVLLAPFALFVAGCSDSPPASNPQGNSGGNAQGGSSSGIDAEDEIARAVFSARTNIFDDAVAAEVVAIDIGKWEASERHELDQSRGLPTHYSAHWTAKLRFKEPIAFILSRLEDTFVVQIVAKAGDELEFKGQAGAMKFDNKWEVNASTEMGSEAGPWTTLWEEAGDVTLGYKVFGDPNRQVEFRTATFQPVSRLGKWVEQGSKEQQALFAAFDERMAKAQAAHQEQARQRREAAEAEQQRVAAEAAEKQRLAQEAAAEKQRLAQAEAKAKADLARKTRLLAVLEPLRSGNALVTTDAGAAMGLVLSNVKIDEDKFSASGSGIVLREMPMREFTFDCSVDERGALTFKSTLGNDPLPFALSGEKLVSRSGWNMAASSEADRAACAAVLELGQRLQSAAPVVLGLETIDAVQAQTREPQLKLAALSGTLLYLERVNAKVLPLFSANMAAVKPYAWKNKEVVALRLAEPVKANGLYIRNSNATENLEVLLNGVHKAVIPSIPKLGGAILSWPSDLEILEIRLTAVGSAQVRTIGLLQ